MVISLLLVRKGRLSAVRQYLSRSEKRQNFAASLLAIVILVFHLAYSLVFPVTVGLAVSSLYAFFAIAVKRNTLLLLWGRSGREDAKKGNMGKMLLLYLAEFLKMF